MADAMIPRGWGVILIRSRALRVTTTRSSISWVIVSSSSASHGTHDFYAERARITRHLIATFGFNAVAVEAD